MRHLELDRQIFGVMATPAGAPAALRRWALLALLAGAVILSGCARIEIAIQVNDDGAGEIALLSALDTRFLDAAAAAGDTEIEDSLIDLDEADLPPGATIEEYDEDGFRGVRARFPFAASDDVKGAIDAALPDAGESAGLDELFERFDLRRDGGGWRFDAVVSPIFMGALPGDEDGALNGELAELMLEEFEFTIRLDLPGEIVEHNADAVEVSALVWSLDPLSEEPRELLAVTSGGKDRTILYVITGIVIALLVAAIAATAATIWLRSRRRDAEV